MYKKLFPNTYSKHVQIKETIAEINQRFNTEKFLNNQERIIDSTLNKTV